MGFKKMTPCKSSKISCSVLPVSSAHIIMSTFAFSDRDTESASEAVSTEVITTGAA